ncbi:hypothetical protein PMAYCL1PPCAC_07866 [Pristionchus mayeri]|uniref:Transmembrane protein 14C n=1 Tax=Pristionchus mayeri TaxID=1317129 RepID=A0AAN5CDL8_9BILA|nr:hypothetical protein PMAYCL1PPCAC_07866 [Pristionchus mayeri]
MDRDLLCLLYAGFLAAGGAIGFAKKGSLPSLLAGVGTGAIVGLSTLYAIPAQPTIVSVISGALTVAMGNRYRKGGKFFPPGAVAIASGAIFIGQALFISKYGWTRRG